MSIIENSNNQVLTLTISTSFKEKTMNPFFDFIQSFFYHPFLSFFIYIYIVIFIPRINNLNIINTISQIIFKLRLKKT